MANHRDQRQFPDNTLLCFLVNYSELPNERFVNTHSKAMVAQTTLQSSLINSSCVFERIALSKPA
jgi:hypothetical protein